MPDPWPWEQGGASTKPRAVQESTSADSPYADHVHACTRVQARTAGMAAGLGSRIEDLNTLRADAVQAFGDGPETATSAVESHGYLAEAARLLGQAQELVHLAAENYKVLLRNLGH